jgi:predicted RNA-binding protein YlqC (UPF0109 family)
VSSFDDEFGLFGDESAPEEDERRPTLGARRIASGETVIDEIEPEDEPAPRKRTAGRRPVSGPRPEASPEAPRRRRPPAAQRAPLAPEIGHPRAAELLVFLAKRLVAKPDAVFVEIHPDARGAVLELEVDPEDLGKVIGRGGRVAQALRTLVRAGAEGRVTIDIVDAEEDEDDIDESEEAQENAAANGDASDAD